MKFKSWEPLGVRKVPRSLGHMDKFLFVISPDSSLSASKTVATKYQ